MTLVEFGRLIQKKRTDTRLSQQKLGLQILGRSGTSASAAQKMVSNIENGISGNLVSIRLLCRTLKIRPEPKVDLTERRGLQVRDWLDPVLPERDVILIAENKVLRECLNLAISKLAKEECSKFRKALTSFK